MAFLKTTINRFPRGYNVLELHPNMPDDPALVDTYQLRLWSAQQLIYARRHTVRDWQMRHFYVQEIARAFVCIDVLVRQEIQCLPDGGRVNEPVSFLSFVHAQVSTDWLTISLATSHTKKYGDLVHVDVYAVLEERETGAIDQRGSEAWGEYQTMVTTHICCTPSDAQAFGAQLRAEIQRVEERRIALGIPKYADPAYGNPSEDE
ncbi:MAG: hypothetical protein IPP13_03455 [Kouleothrix sp.]|jgi:hypothetical protein|nr:hypothetical protein [Kouleothrix sp.]